MLRSVWSLRRVLAPRPSCSLSCSSHRSTACYSSCAGDSHGSSGDAEQQQLQEEYSSEVQDVMRTYEEHARKKQFMIGRVISNKAAKSITVAVQRRKFVSKYNSYQRWTKKVMAHDELEECHVGDIVRIIPCKPKSKKKRHSICDILFKEPQIEVSKDVI